MTTSLTCKEVTRVRLFPCDDPYNSERYRRKLTSKRYHDDLLKWLGPEHLHTKAILRQSDALKWIYQNCRGKYLISAERDMENPDQWGYIKLYSIYVCDFEREHDALHFKLIFSDILEP